MEPMWVFPLFLARVLGLALLLFGLSYSYNHQAYLGNYVIDFLAASVASFWLLLLDTIYLYPRYRSPLRKLPLVPVSTLFVRPVEC